MKTVKADSEEAKVKEGEAAVIVCDHGQPRVVLPGGGEEPMAVAGDSALMQALVISTFLCSPSENAQRARREMVKEAAGLVTSTGGEE